MSARGSAPPSRCSTSGRARRRTPRRSPLAWQSTTTRGWRDDPGRRLVTRPRQRRLDLLARVRLACEIATTYLTVRRLLRRRTLPETVSALRLGTTDPEHRDPETLSLGRHLAWATVRTISLLPADSRCLMRALVLTRLLARRGLGSRFILSATADPEFEAHAWVELGGEPLLLPGGGGHRSILRL